MIVRTLKLHSMARPALVRCHSMLSLGVGHSGNLGHGETFDCWNPKKIDALEGNTVMGAACGASHSLVLLKDSQGRGKLASFGSNVFGAPGHFEEGLSYFGDDGDDDTLTPALLKSTFDYDIAQVAAGDFSSLARTRDGKVLSWGAGILGLGDEAYDGNPIEIKTGSLVVESVDAKGHISVFLAKDLNGSSDVDLDLYWFGYLGDSQKALNPVRLGALANTRISSVAVGPSSLAVIGSNKSESILRIWSWNDPSQHECSPRMIDNLPCVDLVSTLAPTVEIDVASLGINALNLVSNSKILATRYGVVFVNGSFSPIITRYNSTQLL